MLIVTLFPIQEDLLHPYSMLALRGNRELPIFWGYCTVKKHGVLHAFPTINPGPGIATSRPKRGVPR